MKNDYRIVGDKAEIHLPDGRAALIDAAALHLAQAVEGVWYADDRRHTTYVMIGTRTADRRRTTRYLHRTVTNAPRGRVVDHRNGDGMDNTFANLRIVTQGQNLQNRKAAHPSSTTGVRGVGRTRSTTKPFRARCVVDGIEHGFGTYRTLEEASEAARLGRAEVMTHCQEAA